VRVLNGPCYVVSDLHLGAGPTGLERQFLGFLRSLRGAAGSLVINGDLFDFWFEWRSVMPRRGFRVVAALADLVDGGVPVLWIAGNHDCWGGKSIEEDAGVTYHVGPWEGSLAGWRTRIEHGDGLRQVEDRRYRALKAVIRHPIPVWMMRMLHPDVGIWLASHSSETSRGSQRALDGGAGLRAIAAGHLTRPGAPDLVIFGHSHVALLERAPSGNVYANPGSWLDDPIFLRVTAERVEMRRWSGSAEGERIDALDRRAEKALP
jgi:UDP-2,3-diacylglucosamine hydrolase